MKQILPGLWQFTWPIGVNMYLIEDPDGLTLIDTSIPPAGNFVLKALAKRGSKPGDLKRILITHAHPDHFGALHMLKEATGAEVIASARETEVLEGRIDVPRSKGRIRLPETWMKPLVTVDRIVGGGDTLPDVMGGMMVVDTPGHAPGHITFWHPGKRVAISGDVLFNLFGLTLPPAIVTLDGEENKRSVGILAGLDADIVGFGHGPVVQNAALKIRAFARKKGITVVELQLA
jgi:glyoxylase-like metal-dependent hydrolase (beta-lactamase superfamily II)